MKQLFINAKKHITASSLIIALIICILYIFALKVYDNIITKVNILAGHGILLIVISLVATVFLSLIINKIYNKIETLKIDAVSQSIYRLSDHWQSVLKLMAVILICWIPYFIIRFPGNMDYNDTYSQILEGYGLLPLIDHHPFFDTMLYTAFWHLGDLCHSHIFSVFVYSVVQMCFTAFVFSISISYMKFRHTPNVLRQFSIFFYAFYPCIPLFAQTMAKDMTSAPLFVLFCLFLAEIVETKAIVFKNKTFNILLLIDILFFTLTKKTGLYIILPILIILILRYRKFWKKIILLILVYCIAYFGIWNSLILPICGVKPGESAEMLSIPSQQVAYYMQCEGKNLSKKDFSIVQKVYKDAEDLPKIYNPTRADATKARWNETASESDKKQFLKWYLKTATKHPIIFAKAFVVNDFGMFCVDTSSIGNESLDFYRNNIFDRHSFKKKVISLYPDNKSIIRVLRGTYRSERITSLSNAFDNLYQNIMRAFPVIFSKVLFLTWIPLIILGFAFRSKNKDIFILLLPYLLNSLSVAFGPIVLPRYMVISVYSLPLLLCIPYFSVCKIESGEK